MNRTSTSFYHLVKISGWWYHQISSPTLIKTITHSLASSTISFSSTSLVSSNNLRNIISYLHWKTKSRRVSTLPQKQYSKGVYCTRTNMEKNLSNSQSPNRVINPFEPNVDLNREISRTSLYIRPYKWWIKIKLMLNYIILITILIILHEKYVRLYISSKRSNLFI